jgi:GNAT superfamily N-acetyltransferase
MAYRNSSLDALGRLEHMRNLCEHEPGPGVLAFVDGEVAAWCSIAPKATYRALVNSRTIPHVDDGDAWSAVCFRVRVGFRRRGLMHDLLDGAIEHARASGATVIEGYPVDPKAIASTRVSRTWGRLNCSRHTDSTASCRRPVEVVASGAGLSAENSPDRAADHVEHAAQVKPAKAGSHGFLK